MQKREREIQREARKDSLTEISGRKEKVSRDTRRDRRRDSKQPRETSLTEYYGLLWRVRPRPIPAGRRGGAGEGGAQHKGMVGREADGRDGTVTRKREGE
ncbi:hypothetical protein E2C01_015169 [Portunus trituberculatus]|uniref:Uncharacterized protein n=1 Tax=Portunus trituberculatus TaxID=210409 RepID=A0A5B7DKM2_PORTR|nr:hypothetical protein [Portunus trituberculatus]